MRLIDGTWCHDDRVPWNYRNVAPEEFSIPQGHTSRTIHADDILVELAYFDDDAIFSPFLGVGYHLVLYADVVTDFERR